MHPLPRRLQRPLRMCAGSPRCPNRVTAGKCADCRRAGERQRGSAHARGYDSKDWKPLRDAYLAAHPLCVDCLSENNRTEAARAVDHVIPHQGKGDPLYWDPSNLAGRCFHHHSQKTVRHDGGFGNRVRPMVTTGAGQRGEIGRPETATETSTHDMASAFEKVGDGIGR